MILKKTKNLHNKRGNILSIKSAAFSPKNDVADVANVANVANFVNVSAIQGSI